MTVTVAVDDVEFVKEFYPRLREDDAAIERYRASIDLLPPIVLARGRVLVDGFHRWQAHKREGLTEISADDLGNLTDLEIVKESVRRNASHGRQLEAKDKGRMADLLYRQGVKDDDELRMLLSISKDYLEKCLREARADEKRVAQEYAWDLWLDGNDQVAVAEMSGMSQPTISRLIQNRLESEMNTAAPESRQHFDIWQFADDGQENSSYFGRMPVGVVENILWFWTEPGQIVVDPFAGGGTTIDVAKRMGRRVWASDLTPSTPTLPIHQHDITQGWPDGAPQKADLILLDPPYWQQAKGKYSGDPRDLSNMSLDDFYGAWRTIIKTCAAHLSDGGHIAYIISPTQCDDGGVIDHAYDLVDAANAAADLTITRRIIVPYSTQQATGQQVTWARENKRLLKLYRDLVVLS